MKEKAALQVSDPKFDIKDWEPLDEDEIKDGGSFNSEHHTKHSGELFGVLVALTDGEAKSALTELATQSGAVGADDGYQGLLLLQHRFDNQTTSSLLQCFCEVITPAVLKFKDIVTGIHSWERKIALLETKFNERITENIKLAVLIGMLPKEYQDICIQASCVMEKMTYEKMRDHILNVANQRLPQPKPMEVDEIDEQEIDAVGNMLCYNCNKNGHISRNCWQKGGGKGNTKGNPGKGGYQYHYNWNNNWNPKGGKGDTKGGKGDHKGEKGFQGTCFKCGKPGHRSIECKSTIGEIGKEEIDQCEVSIPSVWYINAVDVVKRAPVKPVKIWNMFKVIQEEDPEDDEESDDEPPPLIADGPLEYARNDGIQVPSGNVGNVGQQLRGLTTYKPEMMEKVEAEYPPGLNPIRPKKLGCPRVARKSWRKLEKTEEKCVVEQPINRPSGILDVKWINAVDENQRLKLEFQVADVRNSLLAVIDVCKKGNEICFGPHDDDNFIRNKETGDKIMLRNKKRSIRNGRVI